MDTEKQKKELLAADYEFYGLWKQDLFSSEFWISCYTKEIPNKVGITIPEQGTMVLAGGNFLLKNPIRSHVQKQFDAKIISEDAEFFDRMINTYNEMFRSVEDGVRRLVVEDVSVEVLSKMFDEFYRVNAGWLLAASHLVHSTERLLQDQVVLEKFPADQVLNILPKVETPLSHFQEVVRELRGRLNKKTLESVQGDSVLWNDLVHTAEEYSWVETANFIGNVFTPERLFEIISHSQEEIPRPHSTNTLSPVLFFRAKCMSQAGYMKQASAEFFSKITRIAIPYFTKVAEHLGITYRDLTTLRHEEIISALEGKISKGDLLERVSRRKDMLWAIYTNQDNQTVFSEDRDFVQALMKGLLPGSDTGGSSIIKGQVANSGKITGVVRVIMNTDEFHKMKPGDVLVTTMTTPDFVLLMQQASAIITDIGGLLCHAAIVSRELNKPCIIGTKIATQVLKDGDMVEVDADKGIIKILSK